MATLKLTIFKAKVLKDGRHKIRIAVCHKQETCYIVTRFIIDNLSQFKDGQVVKRADASIINTKLRSMMNDLQNKLDEINHQSLYSCKQIKDMLVSELDSRGKQNVTYQKACSDFITDLKSEGRESYAVLIERSCRYFTEFTRGEIPMSDITPNMIEGFSRYLKTKRNIGNTTIGMMMSQIKAVINRNINSGYLRYDIHPFVNKKIPKSPVREVDISLESLNMIRESTPKEKKYIVARDVFMLSFYLGGMNLIDIMNTRFINDKVDYVRIKTRLKTETEQHCLLPITEPAKIIIDRWIDKKTRKLDFGYKFSYHNFSRYTCRSLATLAKDLGIKEKVVFYSARKSFAQYAFDLGIPDSIIDYCLAHSDKGRGVVRYYTKTRFKQAEIAINRVIDYINNPSKYKEYIEMKADIMLMKT
ncbi:site-specific integrase [Bacteroides fragilis]|nr:site-specific integrase [Bacteroides fragilis]UVO59225.1 site-specific integrase [Bacteroides fragilis]